jgi:hypothetical protein
LVNDAAISAWFEKTGEVRTGAELNSVTELMKKLDKEGIPYMIYPPIDPNHPKGTPLPRVEAIFFADKRTVTNRRRVNRCNKLVSDTSWHIVSELSGFTRVACLATVEEGGVSQILISGMCISDNQLYFDVMLDLLKQEFPETTQNPELMVFSDEDLSFLNAVSAKLPHAKKFICLYVISVFTTPNTYN